MRFLRYFLQGIKQASTTIGLVVALSSAYADPRSTDQLIDSADAVIVGGTLSGQQTGNSVVLTLSVEKSIKGSIPSGSVLDISWSCQWKANQDLKGLHGLWFLKALGANHWTILSPTQQRVPFQLAYYPTNKGVASMSLAASMNAATSSDFVAAELGSALQAYTDPTQLSHLSQGLLSLGQSGVSERLYNQLRTSSDPELKVIGLAGLIHAGDVTALSEMARSMDLLPRLRARTHAITAVLACRAGDSVTANALGQLTTATDLTMQLAAAGALAQIHTRETLPYLAALLTSPDRRAREYAAQGMSRFVANLPIATAKNTPNGEYLRPQGPAPYRTRDTDRYSMSTKRLQDVDENSYLQFWRTWWASLRSELTK